jgi:uncharacterized BrkB/YihY/UPF0761 family membrane protein
VVWGATGLAQAGLFTMEQAWNRGVPAQKLVPGAVAGGIAWTVLQIAGTYLVHHFPPGDQP